MPATLQELKLDPGPQPRRRSKFSCKRLLWTIVAIVCLALTYVTVVYLILRNMTNWIGAPHSHLFQDLTVPYKRNEVVRPLIDSNVTFDIVATVWLRQNDLQPASEDTNTTKGPILVEDAIYSDTLFRGLHLKDKGVKTTVNLSVPTQIFKNAELWNYDLRASFVLVPSSPSPLMFAVNYSSWIPLALYYPPMRAWSNDATHTLADTIVDSYGITVPLLQFHPILSLCKDTESPTMDDIDSGEEEDSWDMQISPPVKVPSYNSYKSTKGKPLLGAHPYIVTRTHIRVLDMTRIKNRTQYDIAHRSLVLSSCGQGGIAEGPSWRQCAKAFPKNGNLETKIKLQTLNTTTGVNVTEWAYAPYMDYSDKAAGPMDLIAVPGCSDTLENNDVTYLNRDLKSTMNITWNIAFSGRTTAKLLAANMLLGSLLQDNMNMGTNTTEYTFQKNQAQYALFNGMFGHRYEVDYHPRYLILADSAGSMFLFLEWILNLHYWFTRSSTVGISIVGTKCLIFAILVNYAVEVMRSGHNSGLGLSDWISTALGRPYLHSSTIPAIWMLKTIKRVYISRDPSSWIPKLHISGTTHTERASERFDSRTPRIYIVMAYAVLGIMLAACNHFDIYVVSPQRPSPPSDDTFIQTVYLFNSAVGLPSYFLGQSLQIILNFRCKTFSGTYLLGPWFIFFGVILTMVRYIPNLFDHYSIDSGWSFPTFIELLLAGILAGQAAIYPPASQQEDDNDAE